jgi:hypothetical protein
MVDSCYTVVQVIALPYSESLEANCVLALRSGDRVFINFETRKIRKLSKDYIEKNGLQADKQLHYEIMGDWKVLKL